MAKLISGLSRWASSAAVRALAVGMLAATARALGKCASARRCSGSAGAPSRAEIIEAHKRLAGPGPSRPRRQQKKLVYEANAARDLLLAGAVAERARKREPVFAERWYNETTERLDAPFHPVAARIRHPRHHRPNAGRRRRARDRARLCHACCARPAARGRGRLRWAAEFADAGGTRWSKG